MGGIHTFKLAPLVTDDIEGVSVASNDVATRVASGTSEKNNL
jgi:hypothetical protein